MLRCLLYLLSKPRVPVHPSKFDPVCARPAPRSCPPIRISFVVIFVWGIDIFAHLPSYVSFVCSVDPKFYSSRYRYISTYNFYYDNCAEAASYCRFVATGFIATAAANARNGNLKFKRACRANNGNQRQGRVCVT